MRIASASDVIASLETRKDIGSALAGGEHVLIRSARLDTSDSPPVARYSPELQRTIDDGRHAIASVHLDEKALGALNVQGMVIGAATGAIVGAGIGILLEQIRAVHPTSAAAFDAACVLIATGMGGAAGSGFFKIKGSGSVKGEFSLTLEPVAK